MSRVVVSLGSNVPNGEELIDIAIAEIIGSADGYIFSPVYQTPAFGCSDKSTYYNCMGVISTKECADKLNLKFKEIEKALGRKPKTSNNPKVEVDIDIVAYNSDILRPKEVDRDYITIGLGMINLPLVEIK